MTESLLVVCPACQAVNRIPQARLGEGPVCGKCKRPLFTGAPVELDSAGFQKQLARSDLPLVVDFWASWCAPCKMMAPAYTQAATQLEPRFRLAKINTEQEQALAQQYNIRSIPTLALFKGGREIARQPGAMDAGSIVRWVQENS
ncbi:MAG: thioredoxin TrxC [Pseudomonadota bacterium]|nr:thioredoxin TrxC [Pseudomonadota bacterium]